MKIKSLLGFTLIELLVVISLIGVLAGALVAVINPVAQMRKARDAQRKADFRQAQSALEMYRSDVGSYPPKGAGNGRFDFPASCATPRALKNPAGTITYMQKIPCDPSNVGQLVYKYQNTPSNAAYTIGGCLEDINDEQRDPTRNPVQADGNPSITSCNGTSNWSYTLYSP